MMPFFCIHISQGSVATRLGCGGVFVYDFVTNFLLSYGQEFSVLFFLTHGVVICLEWCQHMVQLVPLPRVVVGF